MLLAFFGATGCGAAAYQAGGGAGFAAEQDKEINDEDVRKAFEARPQLGEKAHIAYYSFDPRAGESLEGALKAWPGTLSVYQIPALIVTGQRRFNQNAPWGPSGEVSVKKLRLLAARSRADLLVVFDYGYRVNPSANGFAALGALVLPLLFVPFRDIEVESYMEAFVIDTRNGYLYGHITVDDRGSDDYLTIYSDRAEEIIEEQRARLLARMRTEIGNLLTRESGRAKVAAPAPSATPQQSPSTPAPAPEKGSPPGPAGPL
jgi:hypothetical protein